MRGSYLMTVEDFTAQFYELALFVWLWMRINFHGAMIMSNFLQMAFKDWGYGV